MKYNYSNESNKSVDETKAIKERKPVSALILDENRKPTGPCLKYSYINNFKEYIELRNEIEKKRNDKLQKSFKPKPPPKLKEYLVYKCNYLLAGDERQIFETLSQQVFNKHLEKCNSCCKDKEIILKLAQQQEERNELVLRHKVEKDKLLIAAELDVIRLRTKYDRALNNIKDQYNVCSFLRDQEIYYRRISVEEEDATSLERTINQNTVNITPANILRVSDKENEEDKKDYRYPKISKPRTRLSRRMLKVELDERKAQWEYCKYQLIQRHQNEINGLYAYQMNVFANRDHNFDIPKVMINFNFYNYPKRLWLPL